MNIHTELSRRAPLVALLVGAAAAIWLDGPSCLDRVGEVCFREVDSLFAAKICSVAAWVEVFAAIICLVPVWVEVFSATTFLSLVWLEA